MAKKKKEEEGGPLASDLLAKIRKEHGASIIQKASEVAAVGRVRTRIFPLDLGLGGGLPVSRVNVFYGPKSSGKTTLMCRVIGELQKSCVTCLKYQEICSCDTFTPHRCVIVDAEGTLDLTWAIHQGVDVEQLLVSSPEYGEQAVDIADVLIRSGEVHVVAVDSLAYIVPAKEIEKSAEDAIMAEQARLLNKAFRKWVSGMAHVQHAFGFKPTLLCTNQIRSKVGLVFGNPEVQVGGAASGFAATTEIRVQSGSKAATEGEAEIPVSIPTSFKIEKNKTFGPKMSGEYTVYTQATQDRQKGEISTESDLVLWAERCGVLTKQGNKWFVFDRVFNSRGDLDEALIKDKVLTRNIEDVTLEKALERGLALFQA